MAADKPNMSANSYKRRVGTHKQPLGDAITSTEDSWGTPSRSLLEQRCDDGGDQGSAGTTSTTATGKKTNSLGSVTLEGNQRYAEGRPISVGDLRYYLGLFTDPSHILSRGDDTDEDLVEDDMTISTI